MKNQQPNSSVICIDFCKPFLRLAFLLTCCGLLSCTTLRRITPDPGVVFREVAPNDLVDVLLKDGERIRTCWLDAIDSNNLTLRVQASFKFKLRQVSRDSVRFMEIRETRPRLVQPITGKTVRVALRNGEVLNKFTVLQVEADTIRGEARKKDVKVSPIYLFDLSVKSTSYQNVQLAIPRAEIADIYTTTKVAGQSIVQLKKGRTLWVTLINGKVIKNLEVLDFDSHEISCRQVKDFHKMVPVKLTRSHIAEMDTRVFSTGKTVALLIPTAVLVWLGVAFGELHSGLSKMHVTI